MKDPETELLLTMKFSGRDGRGGLGLTLDERLLPYRCMRAVKTGHSGMRSCGGFPGLPIGAQCIWTSGHV